MQFDDKSLKRDIPQNIIIENRSKMSVSGVEDVDNFDDGTVALYTNRGMLTVRGAGLHIERLSLETGELALEGTIDSVEYTEHTENGGFWSRLFK